MSQEKLPRAVEDYLSLLYVLERDGEPIVGARLAELLGVSAPTVTNTLKRMVRDGWVTMDPHEGTHLTAQGLEAARNVMRRHMLTEWMLARMLSWSKLHKEAHGMEHTISAELEAVLLKEMRDPQVCPHGNPLPGHEAVVRDWTPLTQSSAGDRVVIRRVHELAEESPEMLSFLEQKSVITGQTAVVEEVLPFNQTVTLRIEGKPVTLGFAAARYIYVENCG